MLPPSFVCIAGAAPPSPTTTRSSASAPAGARPEAFNSTPVGVNSISSGPPHARRAPMGRTCGEPDEIKKTTHPEYITALFRAAAATRGTTGSGSAAAAAPSTAPRRSSTLTGTWRCSPPTPPSPPSSTRRATRTTCAASGPPPPSSHAPSRTGTPRGRFNSTSVGVYSTSLVSPAQLHVRPIWGVRAGERVRSRKIPTRTTLPLFFTTRHSKGEYLQVTRAVTCRHPV